MEPLNLCTNFQVNYAIQQLLSVYTVFALDVGGNVSETTRSTMVSMDGAGGDRCEEFWCHI